MARPDHLRQPWFAMLGQGASMATEITLDGPVDQLWQGTICSMTGLMSNTAIDFTLCCICHSLYCIFLIPLVMVLSHTHMLATKNIAYCNAIKESCAFHCSVIPLFQVLLFPLYNCYITQHTRLT